MFESVQRGQCQCLFNMRCLNVRVFSEDYAAIHSMRGACSSLGVYRRFGYLVVDITKGIQTQMAEYLVVGESLTQNMVVVRTRFGSSGKGPEFSVDIPVQSRVPIILGFRHTVFTNEIRCIPLADLVGARQGEGAARKRNVLHFCNA
jgi:hypothetical protein